MVVGEPDYASLRDRGLLEFDPQDPDPLRPQNTDEGWAAGLDTLGFGAAFLTGGMAAVRRQARRGRASQCGGAFVPVPARAATLNPIITVEPDPVAPAGGGGATPGRSSRGGLGGGAAKGPLMHQTGKSRAS